jgi:1,2-diacylglycerol 3-alpha-glucosyltransferase
VRIGIFTDTYEPQINGVVTSIKMLQHELEKQGHEVFVLTVNDSMFRYDYDEKIVRVPGLKFKSFDNNILTSIYPVRVFSKIKDWNLDVIHSHTEFGIGTFARIYAKQNNIPLVHTYHTVWEDYMHYVTKGHFDKFARTVAKQLTKFYSNRSTELIVPTNKTKILLEKYGVKKRIHVIPTGIDVERFNRKNFTQEEVNKLKKEFGLSLDDFIVLFVGRLGKEKNIEFVIETMKTIVKENSKIKLVITGKGPDEEKLKNLVKKLKLENNIIFTGPRKDIHYVYQITDVFVTASKTETQGLTVIEAMAARVPVLCYEDDSFKIVLRHGKNGYFFTDKKTLAKQIIELSENTEKLEKMAKTAEEDAKEFSAENFARKVVKVYELAISNKPEKRRFLFFRRKRNKK